MNNPKCKLNGPAGKFPRDRFFHLLRNPALLGGRLANEDIYVRSSLPFSGPFAFSGFRLRPPILLCGNTKRCAPRAMRGADNKYPPAKPEVFHFRAVSPNTTSSAQVALMTTWQSCDCYLPPVNGPFLCLTFFSYAFAPLFCSLFLFSRLLFYPCFFFSFCLFSYLLFFCSFFVHRQSLS